MVGLTLWQVGLATVALLVLVISAVALLLMRIIGAALREAEDIDEGRGGTEWR